MIRHSIVIVFLSLPYQQEDKVYLDVDRKFTCQFLIDLCKGFCKPCLRILDLNLDKQILLPTDLKNTPRKKICGSHLYHKYRKDKLNCKNAYLQVIDGCKQTMNITQELR